MLASLFFVEVGYREATVLSEGKGRYFYPWSALPSFVFVGVNHSDYSPHDASFLPELYYVVDPEAVFHIGFQYPVERVEFGKRVDVFLVGAKFG